MLAKPRRRNLTDDVIRELQEEHPAIDVAAAARDYLNWSGSAKHIDKVQGLRNQLRMPSCATKFPAPREQDDPWARNARQIEAIREHAARVGT